MLSGFGFHFVINPTMPTCSMTSSWKQATNRRLWCLHDKCVNMVTVIASSALVLTTIKKRLSSYILFFSGSVLNWENAVFCICLILLNITVFAFICSIFHNMEQLLQNLLSFILKRQWQQKQHSTIFRKLKRVIWPNVVPCMQLLVERFFV